MLPCAWSFVAMEYYALVLNRTFVLSIGDGALRGVQCRGLTSTVSGRDAFARFLHARLSVRGDPLDPSSYIAERVPRRWRRSDFAIPLVDIVSVEFDPQPKWGMGDIPHNGKVLVRTREKQREFIVLGKQSGAEAVARMRAAAGLTRAVLGT